MGTTVRLPFVKVDLSYYAPNAIVAFHLSRVRSNVTGINSPGRSS